MFPGGRGRGEGAKSPLAENQWPIPLEKSSYQSPRSLEHSYNSSITRKVSHGRGKLLTPWCEGAGFSWLNHKGRIKPGKFRIQCFKDVPVPLLGNIQTKKLLKSGKQEGNYSFHQEISKHHTLQANYKICYRC